MVAKVINMKQKRKEKMVKRAMTIEELKSLMPSVEHNDQRNLKVKQNVSANN
jgi:hypothetical protein